MPDAPGRPETVATDAPRNDAAEGPRAREVRAIVTAKDIGRRLGLSQPTVSRILSGAAGCRVSPETRRRVVEAAAEMGYRPNAVARSLRRRRTNIVGLYCGYGYLDARNSFQAAVIGGLQRAADDYRLDLLLHGVFRGGATEDIYGELVDGRVDGLFLVTHAGDPLADRLRASGLPTVALADAVPGLPSVVCDDPGGVRLLVDHLWVRGHRRIAFLHPDPRAGHTLASVEARREAFRATLAEREGAEGIVLEIDGEGGEDALAQVRALSRPPTAVFCWNDTTALRLLRACRAEGVRVPEELAVVGFDGLMDFRMTVRPLVTVGVDWNRMAATAMGLLTRRINEGPGVDLPALTTLPVALIPGDTT